MTQFNFFKLFLLMISVVFNITSMSHEACVNAILKKAPQQTGFAVAVHTEHTTWPLVLTCTHTSIMHLWDVNSLELVSTLLGSNSIPNRVCFDHNFSRIAVISENRITVWETKTGNFITNITLDDPFNCNSMFFSPRSSMLAISSSLENTLYVWDVIDDGEPRKLTAHIPDNFIGAFSTDESQLIVFQPIANQLQIINPRNGIVMGEWYALGTIASVQFDPAISKFVITYTNGMTQQLPQ